MCRTKLLGGAFALLLATTASADLFPPQNPKGPRGAADQTNYPYPGQCVANGALPWGVPACTTAIAPSFACEGVSGLSNQTAGTWTGCGAVVPFAALAPAVSDTAPVVVGQLPTPKFQWEVLNPLDYVPDVTTFPGADYYEIGLHEANGFQGIASAGLFPNPGVGTCPNSAVTTVACDKNGLVPAACTAFNPAAVCTPTYPGVTTVPPGMQWTGLICTTVGGCSCPSGLSAGFSAQYCAAAGRIPQGAPLFTPIWGVGQINMAGGPVTSTLTSLGLFAPGTATAYSANNYVATWPSISIRATKGRPVVVKWVNEFPNNHVFCPHPEAADWPCAIDRTFMGVKAKIDPALAPLAINPDGVNAFGSPQQPDNSWVTHLHGADTPPATDGFALKWYGNKVTGPLYSPAPTLISPHFDGPASAPHVRRPGGLPAASSIQSYYYDTYTYPMNQDEALIWFHDHTLGKTHHNVIAGPAGFFPVKDPAKHGAVAGLTAGAVNCVAGPGLCDYTWLDPVTEPRGGLGIPKYDLFFALQDRAFNDDGSINFSNGLGQGASTSVPLPPDPRSVGPNTDLAGVVNGVNPDVHPTWVPEYFGDHAVVNGVIWPKKTVDAGWHRIRFADGSDSRCWTLGFSTTLPLPATRPVNNVRFTVIASDQGYLQTPRQNVQTLTLCPGERYEILVDFGRIPGRVAGVAGPVYMTNSAAAPFPAGNTPWAAPLVVGGFNPDREMNVVMRFDVNGLPGVPTCTVAGLTYDPAAEKLAGWPSKGCIRIPVTPDPSFVDLRYDALKGALNPLTGAPKMCAAGFVPAHGVVPTCVSAVRHMYLNERVDGTTLTPLGMQINGVPFEYKVTETPRQGTIEMWKIINLTVDAHPMHPHLVKHLRVSTQRLNVGAYKRALCGSTTCQPGPTPGGEMQLVPDVEALNPVNGLPAYLIGAPTMQLASDFNGGFKDASIALPGQVTTIMAFWDGAWTEAVGATPALAAAAATAPGTGTLSATIAGCPAAGAACSAAAWTYPPVVTGPYVWHCHINSHEDSEMMRTSLVVPSTP